MTPVAASRTVDQVIGTGDDGGMDEQPGSQRETAEQRSERFSKMPGVLVHRNLDPITWKPSTDIWVNEGVTVRDIPGRDDGEDTEF